MIPTLGNITELLIGMVMRDHDLGFVIDVLITLVHLSI